MFCLFSTAHVIVIRPRLQFGRGHSNQGDGGIVQFTESGEASVAKWSEWRATAIESARLPARFPAWDTPGTSTLTTSLTDIGSIE